MRNLKAPQRVILLFGIACAIVPGGTGAEAQRQSIASGAVCYTLEDILEVIGEASNPDSAAFKRYWDAKKATGTCFFNLTNNGQNPVFHVEDTNVAEREARMGGKTFRAIVVRGKIGSKTSGRAPDTRSCRSKLARSIGPVFLPPFRAVPHCLQDQLRAVARIERSEISSSSNQNVSPKLWSHDAYTAFPPP
jgi:hypothetical protein